MSLFDTIDSSIERKSEDLGVYSYDKSPIVTQPPAIVFYPTSIKQCQSLLLFANKTEIPCVIRGAGSGTTGGSLPSNDSILICLDKMNNIVSFDVHNATISVESGVILNDIHELVESSGLFYPPDPASLNSCTIGGNVAENAGGPRAIKYGVTKDYVIGLKGIWANGNIFELGGQQIKNVAGYDLIRLLVGSEGTLGLITDITLKLISKPNILKEALCSFNNSEDAVNALVKVRQSGVSPSTAEFMVADCVDASLNYLSISPKFSRAPGYIIWQVDGFTEHDVQQQINHIHDICKDMGTSGWLSLDTKELSDHVWAIRRNISLGLKKMAGKKCSEDIVVPPASVSLIIRELETMNHPSGIKVLGYGHLGDGNIHVNILKMAASEEDWDSYYPEVVEQVMKKAIEYGGTISGEHGIGITKKKYLPLVFRDTDIDIMKQIKRSVDPKNILNPGKIFDL